MINFIPDGFKKIDAEVFIDEAYPLNLLVVLEVVRNDCLPVDRRIQLSSEESRLRILEAHGLTLERCCFLNLLSVENR